MSRPQTLAEAAAVALAGDKSNDTSSAFYNQAINANRYYEVGIGGSSDTILDLPR
jgi:hypothetical protein